MRQEFEKLLVQSLKKHESKEYALKRNLNGEYVKPETRLAWRWYVQGRGL